MNSVSFVIKILALPVFILTCSSIYSIAIDKYVSWISKSKEDVCKELLEACAGAKNIQYNKEFVKQLEKDAELLNLVAKNPTLDNSEFFETSRKIVASLVDRNQYNYILNQELKALENAVLSNSLPEKVTEYACKLQDLCAITILEEKFDISITMHYRDMLKLRIDIENILRDRFSAQQGNHFDREPAIYDWVFSITGVWLLARGASWYVEKDGRFDSQIDLLALVAGGVVVLCNLTHGKDYKKQKELEILQAGYQNMLTSLYLTATQYVLENNK